MMTLDGHELFFSGPTRLQPGRWTRRIHRRSFPGLDGELLLDGGRRSRTLTQTGRLQADTPEQLQQQIDAIRYLDDGAAHMLVDNHGTSFPAVVIESFEPTTCVRPGRGVWCDYSIIYRQLP